MGLNGALAQFFGSRYYYGQSTQIDLDPLSEGTTQPHPDSNSRAWLTMATVPHDSHHHWELSQGESGVGPCSPGPFQLGDSRRALGQGSQGGSQPLRAHCSSPLSWERWLLPTSLPLMPNSACSGADQRSTNPAHLSLLSSQRALSVSQWAVMPSLLSLLSPVHK